MILEKRVEFLDFDKETKQGRIPRVDGRKGIINLQPDIIERGGGEEGFETLVRKRRQFLNGTQTFSVG